MTIPTEPSDPRDATRRPGLLVVQIDGLSRPLLEELVASGRMPVIGRLLRTDRLRLASWVVQLPSCTPASQAGILHGRNDGIPGFRWYEKATGRLLVANRLHDASELVRRVSDGHGLLVDDGSSIGNLLTGDAPSSHLTLATIEGDPTGRDKARRGHGFPRDPLVYLRIGGLLLTDFGREVRGLMRARRRSERSTVARGWRYVFERAVSTIPLRILSGALVVHELRRGRTVVYVDFTGHDEVAHTRGPRSAQARAAARSVDASIGFILREARHARRPYWLVILSDHGQSWGAPFGQRYGVPLEELVASLMGEGTSYHGATEPAEYQKSPMRLSNVLAGPARLGGRVAVALEGRRRSIGGVRGAGDRGGSPHRRQDPKDADVVVAASGSMALISFAQIPGQLSREDIDSRFPALIDALAGHPGIGLVVVRTARGPVAIGSAGTRHLAEGRVEGVDPVAPYGPHAAASLLRLAGFEDAGDLIVMGALDRVAGEIVSFEELVGTHGGLGGWQTEPFIAYPPEWTLEEDPPIGAPALHRQLLAWMTMLKIRRP